MKPTDVRFSVRQMMIAVAIAATLSALFASPLTKPYPTMAMQYGSVVVWLAPGVPPNARQEGPHADSRSVGVVIVSVGWSDGTTTRHLRRPSWMLP